MALSVYIRTGRGWWACVFGVVRNSITGSIINFFCRYSAVRKQFGPSPSTEVCVLEYQLQVSLLVCESLSIRPILQTYMQTVLMIYWLLLLPSIFIYSYRSLSLSPLPSPYLQQWRLLPYLAAAFALSHLGSTFYEDFIQFRFAQLMGEKTERQVGSYSIT